MTDRSDISADVERAAVASVPSRTIEFHRPTVEVGGQPLSEGFPVEKLTLEVISGESAGDTYEFEKPVIRLGADPLSDVVLEDATVSRMHAELRRRDGILEIIDLGSTNGTFFDEERIEKLILEPGAVFQVGRTKIVVNASREQVKIEVTERTRYGGIIGRSPGLREIFSIMDRVAPSDLSVVIEGETGTGKELIAAAIHEQSLRAGKPFVVFDCSAFPATLLESELFGHEKGAFSGAVGRHRGVFERADGGTIFFDELGEMDIEFQPKFLRVLETGEVRRVGGESTFNVDVRVVAATNRNLEELVAEKRFRQDLFYRLVKVRFNLPALRERVEDIPLLAGHFFEMMTSDDTARPLLTENALRTLQAYAWPGNIRQLRNVMEKAVAMCSGGAITSEYLRKELGMDGSSRSPLLQPRSAQPVAPAPPSGSINLTAKLQDENGAVVPFREAKDELVGEFEKIYLHQLLETNKHNISKSARSAAIDRRHLYRLLKKHGLMDPS